jgi:hypothetical protein
VTGGGGRDRRTTMNRVIHQYAPMHPTLVREPFHRPGWVYEEKVDGWRMLAETWAIVRTQVPRVLEMRAQAARDGWWN